MKKQIITSLGINRLKTALKNQNVAIALDAVVEISQEKHSSIGRATLNKVEEGLLFILNNLYPNKLDMKRQFEKIYALVTYSYEGRENKVI